MEARELGCLLQPGVFLDQTQDQISVAISPASSLLLLSCLLLFSLKIILIVVS